MTSRVVRRPAAALALSAALVLALAGCSSEDKADSADKPEAHSSNSTEIVATDLPEPPEGAAADLSKQKCVATGKRWNFTATLRNGSAEPSTYTVTVAIVDKVGSTVLASGDRTVTVKPGKSSTVAIGPLDPKRPAAEVACVPTTTVERG